MKHLAMKHLLALTALLLLGACGSTPPPNWKTDAADLIERYKKHALRGENTLAERYFQQAVGATGGAGRVADTAHLWLVRCATRRAMLIDDRCADYAELARFEPNPADHAYYQFLTLQWAALDPSLLPGHHRNFLNAATHNNAATRNSALAAIDDPLARLLDASLLVMQQQADAATLVLATDTASAQGWRQPLLTYLKLRAQHAEAQGDALERATLRQRIQLVESHLSSP